MKKIFSLALMATALLISGQVKAATRTVGTSGAQYTSLNDAFDAALDGDVIQLLTNVSTSESVRMYPGHANGTRSLVLDLNGHDIDFTHTTSNDCWVIGLYSGQLEIKGKGWIRNNTTTPAGKAKYSNGFVPGEIIVVKVFGHPSDKTKANYSHLIVRSDVTLYTGQGKCGVNIDGLLNTYGLTRAQAGYAADANQYTAWGAVVDIYGTVEGQKYGCQISGNLGSASSLMSPEDANLPKMTIHSGSEVRANATADEATGVYAAGMGAWDIQGYVHGATGVYVKAGNVAITNATIVSDDNEYSAPKDPASGVSAGGSAIVVDSNTKYKGEQSVIVSGDTKVTSTKGYAVEECITSGNETKVTTVQILGGTYEGGNAGCMQFNGKTVEKSDTTVIIYGGSQTTGDVKVDDEGEKLESLTAENTYVTEVEVNGKITFVVSTGEEPDEPEVGIMDPSVTGDVAYTNFGKQVIDANKTLGVLQLLGGDTLVINAGATLKLDKLTMCDVAQIIIPVGAKLLIMGTEGIYAPVETNLVIEANKDGMGALVFNPAVTTNRTPKATLRFTLAAAIYKSGKYYFDMFTSPFGKLTSISHNLPAGKGLQYQRCTTGSWVITPKATVIAELKPFEALAVTTNYEGTDPIVVTFTGELQGNNSGKFRMKPGYNYFGNGFCAGMSMSGLMSALSAAKSVIYNGFWLWSNNKSQQYLPVDDPEIIAEMGSMPATRAFLLYSFSTTEEEIDLNYNTLIWQGNKD